MSVLAEGISVIACKAAIDRSYAGGMAGFKRDAPHGTFCSDGLLARAGFASTEEARFFLALLGAGGLCTTVKSVAADCVIVDAKAGPLQPCRWVEFAIDRSAIPLCWHTAGRRGRLCAPAGWAAQPRPVSSTSVSSKTRWLRGAAPFSRQGDLVQADRHARDGFLHRL